MPDHYVLDQTSSSLGHDIIQHYTESSDKHKLAAVTFLNTKELSSQLRNTKIESYSIQSMLLFHNSADLEVCVGTNGVVSLLEFDSNY